MKVYKFGGASIQHAQSVKNLAQIIKAAQSESLVVVVSAMGKTTRALEGIFQQKVAGKPYDTALQTLYQFHQAMIDQLLGELRQEALQTLQRWQAGLLATLALPTVDVPLDKYYSRIVAEGECLASRLVYYYLQEQGIACTWLDARGCIKTSSNFCNAQVDWAATRRLIQQNVAPLLTKGQVVLTQGFIGSNEAGETTTLGKEGSDFTGAIFAATLAAQSLTIWKDVPGVMNADPRFFKEATKFDRLAYQDLAEMAAYGAKVVHPKTIQPLADGQIPLHVRPFHLPQAMGTVIVHECDRVEQPVYILQENQGLIRLRLNSVDPLEEALLQEVLRYLRRQHLPPSLVARSAAEVAICLTVDPCIEKVALAILRKKFTMHYRAPLRLLTILRQDTSLLPAPIQPADVLLTHQRPGVYQAVIQHT